MGQNGQKVHRPLKQKCQAKLKVFMVWVLLKGKAPLVQHDPKNHYQLTAPLLHIPKNACNQREQKQKMLPCTDMIAPGKPAYHKCLERPDKRAAHKASLAMSV